MEKVRVIRVIPPAVSWEGLDRPRRACAYVRVAIGHTRLRISLIYMMEQHSVTNGDFDW